MSGLPLFYQPSTKQELRRRVEELFDKDSDQLTKFDLICAYHYGALAQSWEGTSEPV